MPITVPVANESQIVRRQAGPTPRVSTSAPPEAFGLGNIANQANASTSRLGEQAMVIAKEEKQKADDVATTEAYAKAVQLRNKLMYDPQSGALTRKGKDAIGVGEEYGKQFSDGADEIEKGLTNEEQRQMFRKMRANEENELQSNLSRHTFQQVQVYDEETTKAGVATSQDDAVQNYQDPGKVKDAIDKQHAMIQTFGARNGLPPELIKQQMDMAASKTHEAVINRMLANDQDVAAEAYYKSVKDQVHGQDAIQLEKALEEGSLRGHSQRAAQDIVMKNPDMTSALAAVDKISDPKIQDATRERVKARFAEQEKAKDIAQQNAFESAYKIAEQTRKKDSIPPNMWNAMSPAQKNSVDAYLAKDNIHTDWDQYYQLKGMAASPELSDKFLQTDLLLYRPHLADAEFKELVNAQTEARKGDSKLLDGIRTDSQIMNQALADAGIDPTPKPGSKAAKQVYQFWKSVDERVKALQENTGKKATDAEKQGIVDDLMIKGITSRGFFWNTEKHFFELERGVDTKFDFQAKNIPPAERKKIESALQAKGIEVSDDNVLNLYRRKLAGMVPKRAN